MLLPSSFSARCLGLPRRRAALASAAGSHLVSALLPPLLHRPAILASLLLAASPRHAPLRTSASSPCPCLLALTLPSSSASLAAALPRSLQRCSSLGLQPSLLSYPPLRRCSRPASAPLLLGLMLLRSSPLPFSPRRYLRLTPHLSSSFAHLAAVLLHRAPSLSCSLATFSSPRSLSPRTAHLATSPSLFFLPYPLPRAPFSFFFFWLCLPAPPFPALLLLGLLRLLLFLHCCVPPPFRAATFFFSFLLGLQRLLLSLPPLFIFSSFSVATRFLLPPSPFSAAASSPAVAHSNGYLPAPKKQLQPYPY